ncbi:MAG: CocE/NonD family hydrolase, partial [Dehalococcoidia bacterium]
MTILVERDVPVPMRDGTTLRADVLRDAQAGQVPALLLRTPYSKDELPQATLSPIAAVEHGYTVVLQDCRGRYKSEGEFQPFQQEIEDGYDTVEWCGAQDWCNGRVGMYGSSYMGATPWLAAIASPPSLRAIFPLMTG